MLSTIFSIFTGRSDQKNDIHVHTLGDSTLDNLYWRLYESPDLRTAKASSVEGRLQSILGKGFELISHAFDGFTTNSILKGSHIGAVLPKYGPAHSTYMTYMKEKAPKEQVFTKRKTVFIKPLEELQEQVQKKPDDYHYVVLSVGGNDFRENLANPISFIKDISLVQKRYLQIVKEIKSLNGRNIRPILMLQYRTDAKNDPYYIYTVLKIIGAGTLIMQIGRLALLTSPIWAIARRVSALAGGLVFLGGVLGFYFNVNLLPLSSIINVVKGEKVSILCFNSLLQSFYRPILQQAQKDKIPILDLSNTFNPYEDLYDCGIEPGKGGAELIAEGIAHIVKNHDYSAESKLYSKQGRDYKGVINQPSEWRVAYPSRSK